MSLRGAGRAFGLIGFYLLVIVAGLELGTRLVRPQSIFSSSVNTWDPRLGTKQVPGKTGFVSCEEYGIMIAINSRGLRDREFAYEKPPGVCRILSLGDSFACGYGVSVDETYAKVLERELGVRGSNWEVLNAGVGSTGTAHQLAYFVDEGHKYAPDIVVLGFFVANDLRDNVLCGLYRLDDGRLVRCPARQTGARKIQQFTRWIPGYEFLLSRSHFLALLRVEVARWHVAELATDDFRPDAERYVRDPMSLTGRLLMELREACRARGATLVVMVIPAPWGGSPAHDRRESELVTFLEDEGAPCLDLGPAFKEQRAVRDLEYERDGHWTSSGHLLAGELLLAFLDENALLNRSAE